MRSAWINATGTPGSSVLSTARFFLQALLDTPIIAKQIPTQPNGSFCACGAHADITGPRAGDLTQLSQRRAHVGGSRNLPLGHQCLDVFSDTRTIPRVMVRAAPVLLVTGLHTPGAIRIIGPRPALTVIPGVPQRVKGLFVPRRGNVQGLAGAQLDARGERVNVSSAIIVAVQNSATAVLIGIKPRECRIFPVFDDLHDLFRGRLVARRPGNDAAGVTPLMPAAICD